MSPSTNPVVENFDNFGRMVLQDSRIVRETQASPLYKLEEYGFTAEIKDVSYAFNPIKGEYQKVEILFTRSLGNPYDRKDYLQHVKNFNDFYNGEKAQLDVKEAEDAVLAVLKFNREGQLTRDSIVYQFLRFHSQARSEKIYPLCVGMTSNQKPLKHSLTSNIEEVPEKIIGEFSEFLTTPLNIPIRAFMLQEFDPNERRVHYAESDNSQLLILGERSVAERPIRAPTETTAPGSAFS